MSATRTRGEHQAASLLLRMSAEQRTVVHALAKANDKSTPRYLLDLVAKDAASEGGAALARRAGIEPSVVAAIVRQTWEGPTQTGPAPHAEARRAMPVAAG